MVRKRHIYFMSLLINFRKKMNSEKIKKRFYYKHTENSCRVFCIMCNKIAYSTKENKYLNSEKCIGHDNTQCLNSSCANGFSTTYHNNFIVDKRPEPVTSIKKRRDYMEMYRLAN